MQKPMRVSEGHHFAERQDAQPRGRVGTQRKASDQVPACLGSLGWSQEKARKGDEDLTPELCLHARTRAIKVATVQP